tara:strand:+ start:31774 stop:33180 length:1407 start_codon:yes stop_codon:yes gene_type:complete
MNLSLYKFILKPFFHIWDLVCIFLAFFVSCLIRFNFENFILQKNFPDPYWNILIFGLIVWFFIAVILNMQHVPHRKSNEQIWKYFYYPQLLFCFFIFLFVVLMNFDSISRLFILYFIFIQFFLLLFARIIRIAFVRKLRTTGYNSIQMLIAADKHYIEYFGKWIYKNPWSGINIHDINISDNSPTNIRKFYLDAIKNLKVGDYLVLDLDFVKNNNFKEITIFADNKGVQIFELINDEIAFPSSRTKLSLISFGSLKLLHRRLQPLKQPVNQINKRLFDFVFSSLFLIIFFWWIAILIGLAIKLSSKGPIFFRQERTGRDGSIFNCIKFRTMHVNKLSLSKNNKITKVNDPRIYSLGQFLRKYNLDELPQFINVFFGDMSIVGPRPHMLKEDEDLAVNLNSYRIRHWVRPGITGLAAVKGFRGGTEDMKLMQNRINYDIEYIETWSLVSDIRICLLTAYQMLTGNTKAH